MADTSSRFGLPFILPGQAQKELFHNEALVRLDALLHTSVEGAPLGDAPEQPEEGQCWIVAAGASGEWNGRDLHLAVWTEAGWRFIAPLAGMRAWNKAAGYWIHYSDGAWSGGDLPVARILINGEQVLSGRLPAILSPSGGTIIDVEARAVLDQLIATLMSHGLIG